MKNRFETSYYNIITTKHDMFIDISLIYTILLIFILIFAKKFTS